MELPTLQDRRERGDLISLYKIVNGIEKLDKQSLVMMDEETRQMRDHSRKIGNTSCCVKCKHCTLGINDMAELLKILQWYVNEVCINYITLTIQQFMTRNKGKLLNSSVNIVKCSSITDNGPKSVKKIILIQSPILIN